MFTILIASILAAPAFAQDKKVNADQKTEKQAQKKSEVDKKTPPIKTRVINAVSPNSAIAPLKLTVPVTWKDKRSASRMRSATLEIPAAKGDKEKGELSVIILGPQPVDANIDRWVGQFAATGRKQKITKGKLKKGEYYLAEISGTYKKPAGPPIMRQTKDTPGYRMLAVMIPTERGAYFLKMTGPDKTVAAQAKAFRKMFGADSKTEKPHGRS